MPKFFFQIIAFDLKIYWLFYFYKYFLFLSFNHNNNYNKSKQRQHPQNNNNWMQHQQQQHHHYYITCFLKPSCGSKHHHHHHHHVTHHHLHSGGNAHLYKIKFEIIYSIITTITLIPTTTTNKQTIVYPSGSMLEMSNGYPHSHSPLVGSPSPGPSPGIGGRLI